MDDKTLALDARFRILADIAPVMIWISGTDKRCTWFNQGWLSFVGRRMEQEIGDGWAENVHPDDLERCVQIYLSSFDARRPFSMEYRLRRHDGVYRWILDNGAPVVEPGGEFTGYLGSCIDITDLKHSAETESHLAAIVASSNDAIISKTLDGVITSWNHAAERMFGYTSDEAVGRSIALIIPPERQDEERTILGRIRAGDRIEHFETVRVTRDGRRIDVSLTVSPVRDNEGAIVGASKVARDITEQKRAAAERERLLESERAARATAEEASRLKDEFLATVSHELRTPLNSILGWATMLRNGTLPEEKARYAAEIVERNARTQAQLIEDLLDVSSIITGKLRLNVRPIMPAEVIDSALDSVRPMADAKEIRLQAVLDRGAGPISGDAGRLQQVMWNLLSNAIRFTPKQGRVQVRLERINSHLEIAVSDTGMGISAEFLPFVFDRFRQADGSTSRHAGGLGLGLAIVRHILELHGGSVVADSAGEDRGATFTVRLPLMAVHPSSVEEVREHPTQEPARRPGTSIEQVPRLDGARILVVDDEPNTRALLREVLEMRGAEVRDAGSCREGLDRLAEWRPELIISDIGMPGADGYEFIARVREREKAEGRRIPAIALTAYARSQDRMRALLAGYQVHMAKPIDPAELVVVSASLVENAPKSRS
jgi:PAS domain S-box-containing protein